MQLATRLLTALMAGAMSALAHAETVVPAFSMAAEASEQNTPEGWAPVELPQGLPTFTADNTFYITDSRFGASAASADNTSALQAALDAAANAGGGMVVIPAGEFLSGPITVGSKTVLHLAAGATLKLLSYSAYVAKYGTPSKTPFIMGKSGASDIVIEGESHETSILDGQGAPWWDLIEDYKAGKTDKEVQRGSMIRFSQGNRYLFRNFRLQNAPGTNLTIGQSGKGAHATVHDIDIINPASHDVADPSHNTDGIPIWTQYVNIYNCLIDTGDDNIVTDSDAQYVHAWNCTLKAGHGASLGSYTVNMHDILYEDLTFDGTDCGFRLKSNVGRSGDVYNLTFRRCTLTNVASPISIFAYYDKLPDTPAAAEASAEAATTTTPQFHGILIQDVTISGYKSGTKPSSSAKNEFGIFIYGRPESPVYDVTFDNVQISHNKGIKLDFCRDVKFINGCQYVDTYTGTKTTKKKLPSALIVEQYEGDYTWGDGSSTGPKVDLATLPTVTLDNSTYSGSDADNTALWYFADGYSISNQKSKTYTTANNNTIKYSSGVPYTIALPDDIEVYGVTFTGYANDDTNQCYLSNVAGQTDYADDVFDTRKVITSADKYHSVEVQLDEPATGTLTFTASGAQAALSIKLHYKSTLGDKVTLNATTNIAEQNTGASWAFNGGYTISNQNAKGKEYGQEKGTDHVKYSRNETFTINLPNGVAVHSVKFTGYTKSTTDQSYFADINGSADYAGQLLPTSGTDGSVTATFDEPVTDHLSFKVGGPQQVALTIELQLVADAYVTLYDAQDNSALLTEWAGKQAHVTLSGRTLASDGEWNTLCLPFDLSVAGSVLDGATVMGLDAATSGLADGTLTLNFTAVTELKAGQPYIVKRSGGLDIADPTFDDVTFATTATTVPTEFEGGRFVGNLTPFAITADNLDEVLFLGSGSTLGYSQNPRTLRSFRAHLEVPVDDLAPAASRKAVRRYVIRFDDDESESAITELKADGTAAPASWHTLSGQRLHGQPTAPGLYVGGGKKVVVR